MFKRETSIETPTLTLRLKALAVDGALALALSLLLNFVVSMLVGKYNTTYNNKYNFIASSIENSGLANNETSETLTHDYLIKDNCKNFIDTMKTFYVDFMPSMDNSNTYDINYLNTEILEIGRLDYFIYFNDGTEDRSVPGVLNPTHVSNHGQDIIIDKEVRDFVDQKYAEACSKFNSLDSITDATKYMNFINSIIKFSTFFIGLETFFVILPSLLKESLGKKLFKIMVVDRNGKKPSFFIYFARSIIAAVCLGIYSFINELTVSTTLLFIFVSVGLGFMIFTRSHSAIHDFLAGTSVRKIGEVKDENDSK